MGKRDRGLQVGVSSVESHLVKSIGYSHHSACMLINISFFLWVRFSVAVEFGICWGWRWGRVRRLSAPVSLETAGLALLSNMTIELDTEFNTEDIEFNTAYGSIKDF